MKLVFRQDVVFDRSFDGVGEIEELMMDSGLTVKRHDIAGFATSITLFVVSQIISHVRAAADKKNKQAAEQRLLMEIDERLKKYAKSNTSHEAKLVRALNDNMSADVTVVLADGFYRLTSPLTLSSADSGSGGHNVVEDPVVADAEGVARLNVPRRGVFALTTKPFRP